MKKSSLLLIACGLYLQTNAQSTLYQTSTLKQFDDAYELFHKEHLTAAKFSFDHLRNRILSENREAASEYFHAVSALKIDNPDGPSRLMEFTETNPDHPKANEALWVLGNFHFEKRDYRAAIASFQKVNEIALRDEDGEQVPFKLGYSFFQLKDYRNAQTYFERVKRSRTNLVPDAYYYSGYIAMEQGNFDKAISDFKEADKSRTYSDKVPYMLSAMYYRQGYYNELIQYAEPIINSRNNLDRKEEIYLLMAEAYFERRDFPNAARFYDAFVAAKRRPMSRDQKYKAGVAQFETKNHEQATSYFKEVALENDKLGQVSSYYLGHSYLKLNNPQFAVNSFSAAYKSNHDSRITEEALYNYAKVSLERGVFQDAILALDSYLESYPSGTHVQEVGEMLSDALVNTNNYLKAIEHIERLPRKSDRIKGAYQKVAFYQGITYFNDSKFKQAISYFDKSQTYPLDRDLVNQSNFWKGEAYSGLEELPAAIRAYEAVINSNVRGKEPILVSTHYGLGYAYFNNENYSRAEEQFKQFTDKVNPNVERENYEDAMMRLGDAQYVQKKFGQAEATFNRAINEGNRNSDYAYFRNGVVLNFQNRNTDAIRSLGQVTDNYPNSRYLEDAIFQKAQINMEETRYSEAVDGFTRLINSRPNSPFVPFALESRAVANYSLKRYDQTISDYKRILDNFPHSSNANAALVGLQEALSLQGRSGEFSNYLATYRNANPGNESLQGVEFESAKNLFFNQSYKEAIGAFEGYLRNYPQSGQQHEANYFIGDAYYRMGDKNKALEYFYNLQKGPESAQAMRATTKIGEIEYEAENYKKAIPFLRTSSKNARNKIEEFEANRRLMQSYYQLDKYDSAIYFSDQVIALGNVTADAESQAMLLKAKAYKKQKKDSQAEEVLSNLVKASPSEQGAEALFLLAKSHHDSGRFNKSNETIFDLSGPYGAYDYWYGRSFLLLAENYIELGETFQAKATLESIVERSNNEKVKEEAKKKLENL
ncbi:tetratricopeptide repeat protein [Litoribacter populi]|uniref:tetratricopeptide repeat protein n=1 Tax=Litoribacter populi TaxID=2598460 RepID=UPI00117F0FD5|nr:tetratricopeptide repeat protein [Litoribacter populi]